MYSVNFCFLTHAMMYCTADAGSEETSEPKPVPSLLVGYEQEWLSVSPHAVRYWVCLLVTLLFLMHPDSCGLRVSG